MRELTASDIPKVVNADSWKRISPNFEASNHYGTALDKLNSFKLLIAAIEKRMSRCKASAQALLV